MGDMNIGSRRRPGPGRSRILIRHWLKRNGFSSAQLEIETKIHRQTMTAIKNGRDIRLSTIVKILRGARALAKRRVAVEELFDFESSVDDVDA